MGEVTHTGSRATAPEDLASKVPVTADSDDDTDELVGGDHAERVAHRDMATFDRVEHGADGKTKRVAQDGIIEDDDAPEDDDDDVLAPGDDGADAVAGEVEVGKLSRKQLLKRLSESDEERDQLRGELTAGGQLLRDAQASGVEANTKARTAELNQARAHADSFKSAVASAETTLDQLEGQLSDAHSQGKSEDVAKVTRLQGEWANYKSKMQDNQLGAERAVKAMEAQRKAPDKSATSAGAAADQAPKVHALAVKWAGENESWFKKDAVMTGAAMGIDQELFKEGFPASSPRRYQELTRRMAKAFPAHFNKTAGTGRGKAPAVAGVSRITRQTKEKTGKRGLTARQARMADKLGVPRDIYAEYA